MEAPAMLHSFLANFFIAILCHGHVPSTLPDAILLPIPKGHKDTSDSSNYLGISQFGQIKALEVSYNNILQCIWSLPHVSHTAFVHLVAELESAFFVVS